MTKEILLEDTQAGNVQSITSSTHALASPAIRDFTRGLLMMTEDADCTYSTELLAAP